MLYQRHGLRIDRIGPIIIHDDVYVGEAAVILGGASIGEGSIVGAGSVVRKSVPAGSVESWIESDEAIRTLYEATYKRVLVSEAERAAKKLPKGAAPSARIEPQLPHLPLI